MYDVPRLVGNLPVDNAYDVVKNLPGIVNMNNSLMLDVYKRQLHIYTHSIESYKSRT